MISISVGDGLLVWCNVVLMQCVVYLQCVVDAELCVCSLWQWRAMRQESTLQDCS